MPLAPPPRAAVLVVDDDARSAGVLVRMLSADGYDAEAATDGREAIARLVRGPMPRVLVTDLCVPWADGGVIASFARSRDRRLPVVVVTAYPDRFADMAAKLEPPVAAVLTKPIEYAELVRVLGRVTAAGPA